MPPCEQLEFYITFAKELLSLLLLFIGTVVAISGLKTWRKQLTGTTHYELGKRLLKATYKLRNAIEGFRKNIVTAKDVLSATKRDGINLSIANPQFASLGIEIVIQQRWNKVIEAYEDIQIELLEVEALWGVNAKETVMKLEGIVSFFKLKAIIFLEHGSNPPSDIFKIDERGFIHGFYEIENISKNDDRDVIESFRVIIDSIEKLVKPHLAK